MTRTAAALVVSLIANLALVTALFVSRAAPHPPAAAPMPRADAAPLIAAKMKAEALLTALAGHDSAAMRAAGVSEQVVLRLAAAAAFARAMEFERTQHPAWPAARRYWRTSNEDIKQPPELSRAEQEAGQKIEREFDAAMRAAFPGFEGDDGHTQWAFLSPATQAQLRRIEKDYEELRQKIQRDIDRVALPSDIAKLKLLETEQQRDFLAAMTPEESEQYELRLSTSASAARGRWGDAIETEDDYRKVFALQKAFDAKFPGDPNAEGTPPETRHAREIASRQLDDEVRAVIGEENYAALRRRADDDYQNLHALASRLTLSAATIDSALALRDLYATRSMQIMADETQSVKTRTDQLAALATQARADFATRLGAEGATGFLNTSAQWVKTLEGGQAFTTRRRDVPVDDYHGDQARTFYPLPRPH